jgi:cysteine desulfurase/selenocysteine lyase
MNTALQTAASLSAVWGIERVRADFPALARSINGHRLAYLDNGATTQKPSAVIDRMRRFDASQYATVRRGAYTIGEEATTLYEAARARMAKLIGAPSAADIVVTSGATMGINLVAHSWGSANLRPGDRILVTGMEHHANIVAWQTAARTAGAELIVAPLTPTGEIDRGAYEALLDERVKMVAVTHVSNVLGTVNPIASMIALAHSVGAVVLIDGAQAVAHLPVNVTALDADFYVFSSHKMYGPTGVGILYGRSSLLEAMPPFMTGGDMIRKVTFAKTTFAPPPHRFEPGTPPITQLIGLAAAADYLTGLGYDAVGAYEQELLAYGLERLSAVGGVRIFGAAPERGAIISFAVAGAHPHDVVTLLDGDGVACRGGHHCAQPLMDALGVPATTRASMAFYNTHEEIDRLAASLVKIAALFG